MKLLFLDNDHVLNCGDADRWPNGRLPLCKRQIGHLNRILAAVPDLMVVVSSAWRYLVHNGHMKLTGLEQLYMHFGADVQSRLHGVTDKDPYHHGDPEVEGWTAEDWEREGLKWRDIQIAAYCERHDCYHIAVIDDLPLPIMRCADTLFQTKRDKGLTAKIADAVIQHFGGLVAVAPESLERPAQTPAMRDDEA
jgi:hypothetical protein